MADFETNTTLLRQLNEKRILNTVRQHVRISRTNLGKEINIATATVMRIVDGLIKKGWLEEVGPDDSTGGRPAILLQIRPEAAFSVGIELGRVYVRFVCVNLLCEVVFEEEIDMDSLRDIDHLIGYITGFIYRTGIEQSDVIGIGVAAPGPLDPIHGLLLATEDVGSQWHGVTLTELIERQLGIPAYLSNDADAASLGETWFGLGENHNDVLFILADAGIGAGLSIHRSIYRGARNQAGEFSHTIVDIHGDLCTCGRRGCVNTAASAYAMASEMRKIDPKFKGLGIIDIVKEAVNKTGPEQKIIQRAIEFLSVGVYNFVKIFNPDIVILGGRTLLFGDYMLAETIHRVQSLCKSDVSDPIIVTSTSFGISAVAVGAASLVLQQVYDHTQLIE